MNPRVIVALLSPDMKEIAASVAPAGFDVAYVPNNRKAIDGELGQADYLIGYGNINIDDQFYQSAARLKLIQLLSAGYDDIDLNVARRGAVPIANNGGANAISVAEHTMMLMLGVARRITWQHTSVSGGRWRGNGPAPLMVEVFERTLGIVGLGTIGKKVARLAKAFGMRVQYYDIARLSEAEEDALGVRFRLLREILATSDVVSLHVPLNASTRGMIGERELAQMKPTAILVNTCRGPVLDEPALVRALEANRLFGAGLDVYDQEPPPSDNPLLRLDTVLLTAHFAGPTWDNRVTRFRNGFDNVQRVQRGEPPLWVIPELTHLLSVGAART